MKCSWTMIKLCLKLVSKLMVLQDTLMQVSSSNTLTFCMTHPKPWQAPDLQTTAYDSDWERKVFLKIKKELQDKGMSIVECFNKIDVDNSGTVSKEEMAKALAKMDIGVPEREVKILVKSISNDASTDSAYITREAFVKKFWSAITFSAIFESQNISIDTKAQLKLMNAIQKKLKAMDNPAECMKLFDRKKVGFITFDDFQRTLASEFGVVLEYSYILEAFKHLDDDRDGCVKQSEFYAFLD